MTGRSQEQLLHTREEENGYKFKQPNKRKKKWAEGWEGNKAIKIIKEKRRGKSMENENLQKTKLWTCYIGSVYTMCKAEDKQPQPQ